MEAGVAVGTGVGVGVAAGPDVGESVGVAVELGVLPPPGDVGIELPPPPPPQPVTTSANRPNAGSEKDERLGAVGMAEPPGK